MALFYVGHRPVLKERFLGEAVNPYTGEVGKYSNYQLHNTANVLDGAPNKIRIPAEYDKQTPLDRAGEYPRAFGYDFKHLEYHGVESDVVLSKFGYTLADRKISEDPHFNKQDNPLKDEFGENIQDKPRLDPNDPGKHDPGIANALKSDFGKPLPTDNQGVLGHNKINEWNGVESDRAIF